jgi:hypothetical protein
MTMVAVGVMQWPRPLWTTGNSSATGAVVSMTMDSTADQLAWVGKSTVADSLTKLYFRTGTVTTGATVDVRIETVVNGRPSGTLWAANTNIGVAIADGDDNVWKTATLTSAATLAMGDEYAIVIASSAGTPNLALASSPVVMQLGTMGQYPFLLHNSTGAYAVITNRSLEWIAEFSTAGIKSVVGLAPLNGSVTLTSYDNATATNERGLRFKPPMKMRCIGMRAVIGNIEAGADSTWSLWDSTGDTDAEALAQTTLDGDFPAATTNDGYVETYFDTPVPLTAGTEYYAAIRADTANNITLFECPTSGTGSPANAMKAFPAESTELYLATRAWSGGTAGAWSPTTTTMPIIELIIDQLDDGSAAQVGRANYQIAL